MKFCTGCRTVISCYREEWMERYGLIKIIWLCPLCRYLQNTFLDRQRLLRLMWMVDRHRAHSLAVILQDTDQANMRWPSVKRSRTTLARSMLLKETKISQNKKHHRKEDNSMIRETLFKDNSEDNKHRNLLTTIKRNATIISLQNSTYHITNDNTESRLRLKQNLTKTKLTQRQEKNQRSQYTNLWIRIS